MPNELIEKFKSNSQNYYNQNFSTPVLENLYAKEVNDSIQKNPSFTKLVPEYPTLISKINGNYMDSTILKSGIYRGFNNKNNFIYKDFSINNARKIRNLGEENGLSKNKIAVLLGHGMRESHIGKSEHPSAKGVWQFSRYDEDGKNLDGKNTTYGQYLSYLDSIGASKNDEDTLEYQFDFFTNHYIPKRLQDLKNQDVIKIWNNPNSSLEELSDIFLKYIESPEEKNDEKEINLRRQLSRDFFNNYKIGGKFTPKKSQLVKNSETLNSKRDMRKKLVKSNIPTYTNNKIRKGQDGITLPEIIITPTTYSYKSNPLRNKALSFIDKQNNGITPVFNNYIKSKDLPFYSQILQYIRGSNCTLNATRAYGEDRVLGTARSIVSNPEKVGFREIKKEQAQPGDLVVQSLPDIEDGPNNRYHTMILKGFANDSYTNKFGDAASEGEMIYGYSNGENSYRERPHNELMKNHGKTKFRYYTPVKMQKGGVIDPSIFVSWNNIPTSNIELPDIDYTPSNLDRFVEKVSYNKPIKEVVKKEEPVKEEPKKDVAKVEEKPVVTPSKGNNAFNKLYDELVAEMPEAAEYRDFLTTVAKYESGFNSQAKNKYAPAWGYFQFMQDDNKYNNIKTYAGVDTQTFLNDPKLQIKAAINLAKAMEKGFTKEDFEAAKNKGITRWGMLGGAWLGGNGGLRNYLLRGNNISDKHWNPNGGGIDMSSQIKRYNF